MKIQHKVYVTLLIFTGSSLVLILLFIFPTFYDVKSASHEILAGREKALFLKLQSNELSQFKEDLKMYEVNLARLHTSFVDSSNPVDFIKFLEKTSSSLGIDIDISLVDNTKKEAGANTQKSSFKIYAMGNFNNIMSFSERLESGPYLLSISSLSLSSLSEEDRANNPSDLIEANFLIDVVNKL